MGRARVVLAAALGLLCLAAVAAAGAAETAPSVLSGQGRRLLAAPPPLTQAQREAAEAKIAKARAAIVARQPKRPGNKTVELKPHVQKKRPSAKQQAAKLKVLLQKHTAPAPPPLKGPKAKAPSPFTHVRSKRAPGKSWGYEKSMGNARPAKEPIGDSRPGTIKCDKLTCMTDLAHLSSFSLSIPVTLPGGRSVDLGQILNLPEITRIFMEGIGTTLCGLVFSGADITDGNLPGWGPINLGSLFKTMPVDAATNYIIGAIPVGLVPPGSNTQIPTASLISGAVAAQDAPGVSDLMAKGVAFAINPCTNDYIFKFAGIATPPIEVEVAELVVYVDAFGWSENSKLTPNFKLPNGVPLADARFWVPGAPGDTVDFAAPTATGPGLPSKFYYKGHVDVLPPGTMAVYEAADFSALKSKSWSGKPIAMVLQGTASVFVNQDPFNNGDNNGDYTALVQIVAVPWIWLPVGALPLDQVIGKATAKVYLAHTSSLKVAFQVVVQEGGAFLTFLKVHGWIPGAAADALRVIFQSGSPPIRQLDVYGGNDVWGIRLTLASTSGNLAAMGYIIQLLHDYVDSSIPSEVDPVFSMSGPSSGNGLPLAVSLSHKLGNITLYFCGSSSDCPGGSTCTMGMCLNVGCPAGSHSTGPLSCWRDACPSGYANPDIAGVCWEKCGDGEVDVAAECKSCRDSSKPQYDAGFCYPTCRSGYYNAATMCIASSCASVYGSEFRDEPLTCMRDYATYGKGCTYWGCDPVSCYSVDDCVWRGRCGCSGGGNCRTRNNDCRDGYYDAGCFCARDALSKPRSYDRGAGSLPNTRTKKTVTMATLPIVSLPAAPKPAPEPPSPMPPSPKPPPPKPPSPTKAFTDQGCFVDNAQRRVPTLLDLLDGSYSASATIESCASLASTAGYSLFALQNGGQCFGGNDLGRAKSLGASRDCTKACTGNAAATCGGRYANRVYVFAPFTSVGCYADCGSVGRGLPTFLGSTTDMTPSKCADLAKAKGYSVFGVQYYSECWAGNDLVRAKSMGAGTCNTACKGDATKACGGSCANSVYTLG